MTRPTSASPAIMPDAARIPMFSTRARCASLKPTSFGERVHQPLCDTTNKNCKCRCKRQIHPDREQHRALHLNHDEGNAQRHPCENKRPGHISANNALRNRRHQSSLRRWQFRITETDPAGANVANVQHQQVGSTSRVPRPQPRSALQSEWSVECRQGYNRP